MIGKSRCWLPALTLWLTLHLGTGEYFVSLQRSRPRADSQATNAVKPVSFVSALHKATSIKASSVVENLRWARVYYTAQVDVSNGADSEMHATLLVDTGSSDIWVGAQGTRALRSSACPQPRENVTLQYAIGVAGGYTCTGQVCLKSHPRLCVEPATFIIAASVQDLDLQADGILGLGLEGASKTKFTFIRSWQAAFAHPIARPALLLSLSGRRSGSFFGIGELDTLLKHAEAVTGKRLQQVPNIPVLKRITKIDMEHHVMKAEGVWWAVQGEMFAETLLSTRLHCFRFLLLPVGLLAGVVYTLWSLWTCESWHPPWAQWVCAGSASVVGLLMIVVTLIHMATIASHRGAEVYFEMPMILDSGSTLIVVPPDMCSSLAIALLGVYSFLRCEWVDGMLLCDCAVKDYASDLLVRIGNGMLMALRPRDLFTRLVDDEDTWCYAGLQMGTNPELQNVTILGDSFLRSAVVVHDVGNESVYVFPRSDSHAVDPAEVMSDFLPWRWIAFAVAASGVIGLLLRYALVVPSLLRQQWFQEGESLEQCSEYTPLPG